jgi:GAF domain-containing protein
MTTKTAPKATPETELGKRIERVLAKASEALGWRLAERLRRQVRLESALAGGRERAEKAAVELDRMAARLGGRNAVARDTLRLAALIRIRGAAAAPCDVRELLAAMVQALAPAIPYESATAFVYEKGAERLVPVAVQGAHVDLIPDIHFDNGAGFSSWVAKTRRPVLLSSFREDPNGVPVERPASFLSIPVLVEEEVVGVLNFAHRRPGTFTPADRDLVLLAARLVTPAITAPEAYLLRSA